MARIKHKKKLFLFYLIPDKNSYDIVIIQIIQDRDKLYHESL